MSSFILDISLKKQNEQTTHSSYTLQYTTSGKFPDDKVNVETDDVSILLDGIVLNKKQLLSNSHIENWADFLIESYQKNGALFFNKLKGSYYGFLLDKRANKWIVFTDHISSKPMYYAEYSNNIVFSNNYTDLVNNLKQSGVNNSLNEQGAYLLLTYGYVFEDITITNEIKRLLVGYCAQIQNNQLSLEKVYSLTNTPIAITEQEAIEEVDTYFRQAVQLAFEKDKEYGYKHVATLSGGLDSRMTVWVAHDMGYTNQLNLTFSQSNYLDESIAKQIAADLKHEWLFKALDNGSFLMNIDETIRLTGGNVLYYGLAHALSLYDYLSFDTLGITHSGQLGDVVVSTFYSTLNKNKHYAIGDGAYSKELLPLIKSLAFRENYPNEEIFKFYIRGFYGANHGLLSAMKYTETYSPFYDIDFMGFALSLPLELRFDHSLYKKWIIAKYPEAAAYVWERDKVPVNYSYWVTFKGKRIPLNQIPVKIAAKLGFSKYGSNTKNNMNPLVYWYQSNPELKAFMDGYFNNHIGLLDDNVQLKKGCQKLYFERKGTEKVQVLTLLAGIKNIV